MGQSNCRSPGPASVNFVKTRSLGVSASRTAAGRPVGVCAVILGLAFCLLSCVAVREAGAAGASYFSEDGGYSSRKWKQVRIDSYTNEHDFVFTLLARTSNATPNKVSEMTSTSLSEAGRKRA